jgi:colanic acid biosynthesis glycosyl transferase WcaI
LTDTAAQSQHAQAAARTPRRRILVISQTFYPDPAAVGQHMTDAAKELARRGYDVRVYASARGYENPSIRYAPRETITYPSGGILDIRRLTFGGFGKKNLLIRILGTAAFMAQVFWYQLTTTRVAGIFFSTSPPMVGLSACIVKAFRRIPSAYWAMDLNPDQLIAMKKIKPRSLIARVLEAGNRFILRHTNLVIALDRFMKDRLLKRGNFEKKIAILPPWPPNDAMEQVGDAANPFRQKHNLVNKRVIMYSGNHSPANPLTTLLQAAIAFKNDDRVHFVFVGGGLAKKEVEATIRDHGLTNMLSLPYQPLEDLKFSLTAADIHVVSMGTEMAGIIHPCKIYGAMEAARPILYLGPAPSHISDILEKHHCGWQVSHGDVQGMQQRLTSILAMPPEELHRMGQTGHAAVRQSLSQEALMKQLGDLLQSIYPPPLKTTPAV